MTGSGKVYKLEHFAPSSLFLTLNLLYTSFSSIHEAARVRPGFPEINRLRPLLAFFMNVVVSGTSNSLCLAERRLLRVGLRFAEESELVEVGRGCTLIFGRRRWGRRRRFNRKRRGEHRK